MADLGINLLRREGEHVDLALGFHADTGASVSANGVKGYFLGIGGEAGYDADGNFDSFGASFWVIKFHVCKATIELVRPIH